SEVSLQVVDRVGAVMKNRSCQRGVRFTFIENADEVFWLSRSARSDHGNFYRSRNCARQLAIKTALHAIGVHRSEKNLARAAFFAALRTCDGVDSFIYPAAFGVNIPLVRQPATCVDC